MMISLTELRTGNTETYEDHQKSRFLLLKRIDEFVIVTMDSLVDGDYVAEYTIGEGFTYYTVGLLS